MPHSPTAEMQTTLSTTTNTTTTTFSKTKQLAVRTWLEDIPAFFVSSNTPATAQLCTMARSSEKSLATLAASGTIVLFTPVVAAANKPVNKSSSSSSSSSSNTDPFEPLGRALSRHHKRIRHVPYHPRIGFTDTHDAFCSQADAVVVVMCDALAATAATAAATTPAHKAASLRDQLEFAENAHAALKESLGRLLKHPVALVQCGSVDEGAWWPKCTGFEVVLKCRESGDAETAREVARKLFGKD